MPTDHTQTDSDTLRQIRHQCIEALNRTGWDDSPLVREEYEAVTDEMERRGDLKPLHKRGDCL